MTTDPGWYPDPQVPALLRWWDGQQWTQQTAAAAGSAPTLAGYANPAQPPPPPAWASPAASTHGVPTDFLAAPPAKRNTLRWVAGSIAAVLVLATVSGGVLASRSSSSPTKEATSQATGYLRDLASGAWTSAYQRLCVADRRAVSPSRFAASKESHHPLSFSVGRTAITTRQGVRTATVTYKETSSDRGAEASVLTLQYTVDGWLVCHPGIAPDQWAGPPSSSADGNNPTLST